MSCNVRTENARIVSLAFLLVYAITNVALAEERSSYSFNADAYYPTNLYWGDTHLHTSYSIDAYSFGNRAIGPDEAYRFAKGEPLAASNGEIAKLSRALDFLVIADHAMNMGVVNAIMDSAPHGANIDGVAAAALNKVRKAFAEKEASRLQDAAQRYLKLRADGEMASKTLRQSIWAHAAAVADAHNDPGTFTTLIGYEWTPLFNLHRVVVFRDGASQVANDLPYSSYDGNDPEGLWENLAAYEAGTGGDVLAIPHNGNLTGGVMFALQDAKGNRLTKDYSETRSRWEPLYEVTQTKGDTETHAIASLDDAFADFETVSYERNPLQEIEALRTAGYEDYKDWYDVRRRETPTTDWMKRYEYARPALKLGLSLQEDLGANPFKFGLVGGSDAHTGFAAVDENNFWGTLSLFNPSTDRIRTSGGKIGAAGYTAVWAKENTREAIFDAMKRKEVYATTGSRITLRVFAGFDYDEMDAFRPDLARIGYKGGVPMGGDLTAAPDGKAPRLLIRVVKDPDGANLDRVQVIKGWRSEGGELHEKIYDVALSDNRKIRKNKRSNLVGSTVNVEDASYTNTIGDAELAVVWEDPDFNHLEHAFYYVRVLEIPTPRWTAYDAKVFALTDMPKDIPMVLQERAYSSPVWYRP